jgi:hypothetical protein
VKKLRDFSRNVGLNRQRWELQNGRGKKTYEGLSKKGRVKFRSGSGTGLTWQIQQVAAVSRKVRAAIQAVGRANSQA